MEILKKWGRVLLPALLIYAVLVCSLYYLMGEQLHFRESRGNISLPAATTGTVELIEGSAVSQRFVPKIQRLEKLTVQFGAFYRVNAGTVRMHLVRTDTGALVCEAAWDAATIGEGTLVEYTFPAPVEGLYGVPMELQITSDSMPGLGVAPLMNGEASAAPTDVLLINGVEIPGTLCFAFSGTDYVWTGLHYWEMAVGLGLALLVFALYLIWCVEKGKRNLFINAWSALNRYSFLIKQMVSRDFKAKYKRSILGVFWSFLNPLLTMGVQYIIFSTLFRNDVPYFAVYLLSGVVIFNFFSEVCSMTLTSITGNASLITKVYVPKYIYPLTRVMSSGVNLLISLIPLLAAIFISGLSLHKALILIIFPLLCVVIFSLGFGLVLATSMVFFRDTQFLWGIVSMLWMYGTPIFYPETILTESLRGLLQFNPLYHFIGFVRTCVIDGISPEPRTFVICFIMALGMLAVGALIFKKNQDKFVLYL